MFRARDDRDVYNILPRNFGLIGERSIYSHFKNVKKWTSRRRNSRVDGIVLLKQFDVPQNQLSMGRIMDVNNDRKDLVRSVTLKIGECAGKENSKCKLE